MQAENFVDSSQNGNGKKPSQGYAETEIQEEEIDYTKYTSKSKDDWNLAKILFTWLKTRTYRFWMICLFISLGAGSVASIYYAMNNKDTKIALGTDKQNSMALSQVTPAMLGGITPDTPEAEVLARLQDGTIQYETLLNAVTSDTFRQMYQNKAYDLYQSAVKEELSGKFQTFNRFGAIDLKQCPTNLGRVRLCVLTRYALEGLAQYREGLETDDLDKATLGFNKFNASILALQNPGRQAVEYTRPIDGNTEYIKAIYEIMKAIPPSAFKTPIGVKLDTPQTKNMKAAKTNAKKNQPINAGKPKVD
jgi:hypothetical protein